MLTHIEEKRRLRAYENGLLRRIFGTKRGEMPIPVTARSKAWVCGRLPAEIFGFESHRGHGYLSVVSVVCC